MSQKEAPRIGLLKALVARRVTGREVAAALDVTVRQVWRLKRRFETEGADHVERGVSRFIHRASSEGGRVQRESVPSGQEPEAP